MAATNIQIPPDSTGKRVAAQDFTRAAQSHYRQELIIGGITGDVALADVLNANPTATAYGVSVRIVGGVGSSDGGTTLKYLSTDANGVVNIAAAALPLPTGASTAAKQPALGTAGTPSIDVITVQGRAAMTPVFVNLLSGSNAIGSFNLGGSYQLPVVVVDAAGAQVVPGLSGQDNTTTWTPGTNRSNPLAGFYTANNLDATAERLVGIRATIKRTLMVTPFTAAGVEIGPASEYQAGVSTAAQPYGGVSLAKRDSDNGMRALALDDNGNLKVVGTGTGGTSISGNGAWTSTSALTPIGGCCDEPSSQTISDNQHAMARITPKQAIHFNPRDNGGAEIIFPFISEGTAHPAGTKLNVLGARREDDIIADNLDAEAQALKTDKYGRLRTSDRRSGNLATTPKWTRLQNANDTDVIGTPGATNTLFIRRMSVHNRASTNRQLSLKPTAGSVVWSAKIKSEGGGVANIDFGPDCWVVGDNKALVGNLDDVGDIDVNVTEYYIGPTPA